MLWPPFVKIYQDGTVIHYNDSENKFYVGRLDTNALESIKRRLSSEKYLSTSRFIDMNGDQINVHGGVSYIRYLDGDNEVLLATEVKPQTGRWRLLTEVVRSYIPDAREPYYPASIKVQTWEDESEYSEPNPPVWPFASELQLRRKPKMISKPEITRYLFQRMDGVFSFFVWDFKDNGKRYAIALIEVPGWFEQSYLNKAITKVRKTGSWVKEP